MSTRKGIGYSPLTDRVLLGRQDRTKGMWVGEKEDITNDFIGVMLQYIEPNTIRIFGNGGGVDNNLVMHVECTKKGIESGIKALQERLATMGE